MKRREGGDSLGFREEAVKELAGEANPDRFHSWDFRELALLWPRRREFKEGDDKMGQQGDSVRAWPGGTRLQVCCSQRASCPDSTAEPELGGMAEDQLASLPAFRKGNVSSCLP